jgi:hypothetical protein
LIEGTIMRHPNSVYSPLKKIALLVGVAGGSLLISVPSFAQNENQTAPRSQQYREECQVRVQSRVERDRAATPGNSAAIDSSVAGNVPNRTDPRTLTPFERGNMSQNGQRERSDRVGINRTGDTVNSNPTRLNPSRDGLRANRVPAPCVR